MKKYILFGFFLLSLHYAHAQSSSAKIIGNVIDSSSRQPLDYATITLFLTGNTKPVNGATTNTDGSFQVKGVIAGKYKIMVEFIGYKPVIFKDVLVKKEQREIDLKTIVLAKKTEFLKTITIAMPEQIIENKIDKIVFNADKDITSQGGVATDILKKVPQVSVDIDGNVELAGSSSIRFLIDGKPSSAFGNNIADVLQSIPASQIKSIEVVTNPGAKYDAQGLGGIINIILKKNTAKGVNGNISLTGGTLLENGSFNFNARNKNFGINAFVSGNKKLMANSFSHYERASSNSSANASNLLNQDAISQFSRYGMESGIGFDWTYNKKNNFSGSVNYNRFGNTRTGITNQSQITKQNTGGNIISDIATTNNAANSFRFHNIDANLNYKRTFDNEDRELDISINSSFGNNFIKANNNQFLLPQDSLFYGTTNTNPGKENETEFKVDYTEPLAKKIILGVGGKVGLHDITGSSDVLNLKAGTKAFLFDSSLSNSLKYHQQVYAIYSELSFPAGKLFDVKIGGRYERTNINSYYSNAQQQKSSPGYNTFVPSIFLLKKLGDNQTIKLSYSKRIERPRYEDLNPFINASDPQNISTGNPYLKPEIGNRYELGYSVDFGKTGSFMITASYRANNHDIQNYIIYYPTFVIGDSTYKNVAVNTQQNIGLEKNVGISLFNNLNFTTKFTVRTNVFLFQRHTINALNPGYNSSGFSYRFNMNASYQFAKTFAGEIFGNYRSRHREAQGTYPSFIYYSLALRKQFWNKKGSLALTATNPFNEYVILKTSLIGPGFTVNSTRKIPFRSFGINFTWKFGKLKFKKEDTPVLNQPDEGG